MNIKSLLPFLILVLCWQTAQSQVINEGSNRNYTAAADEDGEFPDWIELHNPTSDTVHLLNYSLTDDPTMPAKWTFPNVDLLPGAYQIVFCSGKDRKPVTNFIPVLNTGSYTPTVGWNTHNLTTPFHWDGISNILINICSYNSTGYTSNSIFNQTQTPYYSTVYAFVDGSPSICQAANGAKATQRPNIQLNSVTIGTGTVQNSGTDYPAPYGNWYWAAKHQLLITATELTAAGLTAGNINSLGFDVAATDPNTHYDYIDMYMKLVSNPEVSTSFEPLNVNNFFHTNFKLATSGETVYLYNTSQNLLSQLLVNCSTLNVSTGSFPDANANITFFQNPTAGATNNSSTGFSASLLEPNILISSGVYNNTLSVGIQNPNGTGSSVRYTLDGSDPTLSSPIYNGTPINIFYSTVLKAKAFSSTALSSPIAVASYLLGINHFTPVLSVVTDPANLYGANGIFDNWQYDWEKAAYTEYFDENNIRIFSQNAGMQIDGGAGGSRSNPQHSFRIELDDAVLGEGPVNYPLIPNRPTRGKYSKLYLRNGSNQYLIFPHKDACQVEALGAETNNYYSAWRPVTVYVNGGYFGLYEMREKFDSEYFEEIDQANPDSLDLLSLSYWNGSILRPVVGSVDSFYNSYDAFNALNPASGSFWNDADHYFDMAWYTDYIIAESWVANTDWPFNNIKIYRSDKTNYRWRFCIQDLEWALSPHGWTDRNFDHIDYMLNQSAANPYINIWLKGMQNPRFRNYFINRFADIMNTAYLPDKLLSVENSMFDQTILEMPNEYARWGDPNNINGQMNDFYDNHLTFQSQLTTRTTQVRNHIQINFSLVKKVNITLDVTPAGAGKVKISTVTPDSLPWTGVYFDGNSVSITAIANPGYTFSHWQPNAVMPVQNTNISNTLNVTTNSLFNAVFIQDTLSSIAQTPTQANRLQVFPNPSSGKITVGFAVQEDIPNSSATLEVFNILGEKIYEQFNILTATPTEIDLSEQPGGVYIVNVSCENEVYSRKVVIGK